MDWRFKKKSRLVREFFKGQHQGDEDLEEDYLDWFFLRNFNREPSYWRGLSEDKLMALITLEQEKEKQTWEIWAKMFNKMFGSK